MKSLFKIFAGVGIIGLLWKFTPLVDILYLFFMIFMIPMVLFLSLGIISTGTYELMSGSVNKFFQDLKDRKDQYYAEAAAQPVPAVVSPDSVPVAAPAS